MLEAVLRSQVSGGMEDSIATELAKKVLEFLKLNSVAMESSMPLRGEFLKLNGALASIDLRPSSAPPLDVDPVVDECGSPLFGSPTASTVPSPDLATTGAPSEAERLSDNAPTNSTPALTRSQLARLRSLVCGFDGFAPTSSGGGKSQLLLRLSRNGFVIRGAQRVGEATRLLRNDGTRRTDGNGNDGTTAEQSRLGLAILELDDLSRVEFTTTGFLDAYLASWSRSCLADAGVRVLLVDLETSDDPEEAEAEAETSVEDGSRAGQLETEFIRQWRLDRLELLYTHLRRGPPILVIAATEIPAELRQMLVPITLRSSPDFVRENSVQLNGIQRLTRADAWEVSVRCERIVSNERVMLLFFCRTPQLVREYEYAVHRMLDVIFDFSGTIVLGGMFFELKFLRALREKMEGEEYRFVFECYREVLASFLANLFPGEGKRLQRAVAALVFAGPPPTDGGTLSASIPAAIRTDFLRVADDSRGTSGSLYFCDYSGCPYDVSSGYENIFLHWLAALEQVVRTEPV